MAIFELVFAALLLVSVSADPDVLQGLYVTPNDDHSAVGSSGSNADRSGLISSADASIFESEAFRSSGQFSGSENFNSAGSKSTSLPESIFANVASSADSPSSVSSAGSSKDSFFDRNSGVMLSSSQNINSGLSIDGNFASAEFGDVTITHETTVDVFKTVTNVIYNSIPITLTEFMKTTAMQPTFQVLSTAVDDHVFVATAPVTRTDSVTVTDTNTGYFYVTEVSTDLYTITHKAYNILQQTLTSTLQQTKVFRPTVVRTRINTEYDTQTVEFFVSNTVVVQGRPTQVFGVNSGRPVFQQFFGQGQQQGSGSQQVFGQGQQQGSGSQQTFGQGQQQGSGSQQTFGQGQQQGSGSQQTFGQGQQQLGNQNFGQGPDGFQGQQVFGIGSAPGSSNRVRSGSINAVNSQSDVKNAYIAPL